MGKTRVVYQFRLAIQGISPPIWRRIQVPARYNFWDLHVAIQDSMGWQDCHLHVFRIPLPDTGETVTIGVPDREAFEDDCLPGWRIPITRHFLLPGTRAQYEYDFGDGWEHELLLETVAPRVPGQKYPTCLAGSRSCPPEDCGGTGGYERLLTILRDPSHEDYADTLRWLGGTYDPEAFDPEKVHFDDPAKRWRKAFGVS